MYDRFCNELDKGKEEQKYLKMKDRRYIVNEEPTLFTLMEIITENMADDVEPLVELELLNLIRMKRDVMYSLPLGNCEIRRVI